MSLINQDIKNLVSGISQQPPVLRHPEQLEEQINGISTEASGLQKRPPTIFIDWLSPTTTSAKPLIHFVNRDTTEQYCMIFFNDSVAVYDLQGSSYTVIINDSAYLKTDNPREDLKLVTIADYTFVVNKKYVPTMSPDKSEDRFSSQGLLVNIKSGQYGRTYKIEINGNTVASYTTPDGSDSSHASKIATDYIVDQLESKVDKTYWTVEKGASWIYIYGHKVNSFAVYDGYNNEAAFGFHDSTQRFSYLPYTAPNGFIVAVKGEEGSTTDDYYVKYDANEQVWKETCAPNIQYMIDSSTMPHALIRKSTGTFSFECVDWTKRLVGDETSNPIPSFIGQPINDIFYHRNRLGFLAGENIILSRSADFFNFWMTSATKVQDTDPIDLAASDSTVCTLYSAVPYDKDLIIFSREAQFSLTSATTLTPKDANLTPAVTHYEASLKSRPVNAGRNIYFVAERALYSTVREFFTAADNTESKDVQDITSHCPNYIPNGVYKIIPSTVENIMLFLTEGDPRSIYVYKYLFIDSQRVQAAWSKWEFDDKIFGGAFIDNMLYLVFERNGFFSLEKMSFIFNTTDFVYEPYRVLLDCKTTYTIPSDCYDPINDETVVPSRRAYSFVYNYKKTYSAVATDGTYVTKNDQGYFVFPGNYTGDALTIGINYNFKIKMSTTMVKQTDNNNTKSLTDGRLQLRQMWFNYANSGYFKVTVEHMDKGKYTYEHTSRLLGTKLNILGDMPFTTGSFRFPVQSKSENVSVSVDTDAPLPVALVGAGWIGNYQRRSRLV